MGIIRKYILLFAWLHAQSHAFISVSLARSFVQHELVLMLCPRNEHYQRGLAAIIRNSRCAYLNSYQFPQSSQRVAQPGSINPSVRRAKAIQGSRTKSSTCFGCRVWALGYKGSGGMNASKHPNMAFQTGSCIHLPPCPEAINSNLAPWHLLSLLRE